MKDRRSISKLGSWEEMRSAFRWPAPARYNMAERCCDSWAEAEPDRTAIVHLGEGGERELWSYGRLKSASDGLASSLDARGVRKGDRVAVLLAQSPATMVAHMAIYKLGAVVLPLFAPFGPDALAYRLADSEAKALVTDAEGAAKTMDMRGDLPGLKEIYSVDRLSRPIRFLWDEIASASGGFEPASTSAEEPALLIYTSGTTGPPKGVLHAQRVLVGHLPCIETFLEGFPQPGDVGWTPADWAWIGGLMDMAMPCLHFGVPLVSRRMRRFDPEEAWRLIAAERVRTLFLPPTALKLLRQASVPDGADMRAIGSGGESLGSDLLEWSRETLGAPVNEIYGQTECNLVVSSCAALGIRKPGAMGKPVPGHDVEILDEDGRPLPAGQTGEIAVRSPDPAMFLQYWNRPEATAAKFSGPWMRTGDLGSADGDGYLTYMSRDDDVITSAGYRIGPSEIEHCLSSHPDVVMAAAVGVPDPERTEAVKAFVVLRDGASWEGLEEALIARVRSRVSPHVAPRGVERVESMPMTATGKIMRRALRERAAG